MSEIFFSWHIITLMSHKHYLLYNMKNTETLFQKAFNYAIYNLGFTSLIIIVSDMSHVSRSFKHTSNNTENI